MSRTSTPTATSPRRSWRKRRSREISPAPASDLRPARIVAVDPGISSTGYGVMEKTRRRIEVLAAGTIAPAARRSPPEKLAAIYAALVDLLEEYSPGALVLEDVFYHKNVRSTLRLGEVRGICALAAAQRGLVVHTYASRRVKKAVVGNGAAGKLQVRAMVQALLGLEEIPGPLDVSDALALGIAYFQDNIFLAGKN